MVCCPRLPYCVCHSLIYRRWEHLKHVKVFFPTYKFCKYRFTIMKRLCISCSVLCISEELSSMTLEKHHHHIIKSQCTSPTNRSPSPCKSPIPSSNPNPSSNSCSLSKSQPTHSSPDDSAEVTYRSVFSFIFHKYYAMSS